MIDHIQKRGTMKVRNIESNQTEIEANGKLILVSYSTPVAAFVDGKPYRTATKYSATTSRHINQWLGASREQSEEKPQEFFDNLLT